MLSFFRRSPDNYEPITTIHQTFRLAIDQSFVNGVSESAKRFPDIQTSNN